MLFVFVLEITAKLKPVSDHAKLLCPAIPGLRTSHRLRMLKDTIQQDFDGKSGQYG